MHVCLQLKWHLLVFPMETSRIRTPPLSLSLSLSLSHLKCIKKILGLPISYSSIGTFSYHINGMKGDVMGSISIECVHSLPIIKKGITVAHGWTILWSDYVQNIGHKNCWIWCILQLHFSWTTFYYLGSCFFDVQGLYSSELDSSLKSSWSWVLTLKEKIYSVAFQVSNDLMITSTGYHACFDSL